MKRDYKDPAYTQARQECLARDKRRCQMPGCKKRRYLQVHHIHKWSVASTLRFEISNLITLCKDCHLSIKGVESHFVPLFEELIRGRP